MVVARPVRPCAVRLALGQAVGRLGAAPPLLLALVGAAVRAPRAVPLEGKHARATAIEALSGRRLPELRAVAAPKAQVLKVAAVP